jgi:hypothetical protein
MRGFFGKEPSLIIGTITAALVLLVQFGVDITGDQQQAILGFASALLVLVGAAVTRQNVASPATLRQAGTSLHQVATVADPALAARLIVVGDDAHKAPK